MIFDLFLICLIEKNQNILNLRENLSDDDGKKMFKKMNKNYIKLFIMSCFIDKSFFNFHCLFLHLFSLNFLCFHEMLLFGDPAETFQKMKYLRIFHLRS